MPRTLVAYHTPSPLTMAKIMTMTMVSAGWRSGCAIILMYITSPSIRVRRTTIIGKLYFFCVMLSSHFDIYADFKELGIVPVPGVTMLIYFTVRQERRALPHPHTMCIPSPPKQSYETHRIQREPPEKEEH